MVRLDDGQPPAWPAHLGDRIRGPGEALLDTYSLLSQVIPYPFFAFQRKARGISLILQVNGEAGRWLSLRVKTGKEEGGRIISEKTVSKSAFFCNFAPAKH